MKMEHIDDKGKCVLWIKPNLSMIDSLQNYAMELDLKLITANSDEDALYHFYQAKETISAILVEWDSNYLGAQSETQYSNFVPWRACNTSS